MYGFTEVFSLYACLTPVFTIESTSMYFLSQARNEGMIYAGVTIQKGVPRLRLGSRCNDTTRMTKDEEIEPRQHENATVRAGLKQAPLAIDVLQERVKAWERQKAKESHKRSLPPSSDRFVRPPTSVRQPGGKQPGGQPGHRGHHLPHVEGPDDVLIHP